MSKQTFWEEASVAIAEVLAEEPSVAEFVVALNQLNAVTLGEGQLIGAAGHEVICSRCGQQKEGVGFN